MGTLSINQKKLVKGLSRRKVRQETGLFLVEGDKIVREVLSAPSGGPGYEITLLAATDEWLSENRGIIGRGTETCIITASELKQLSSLRQPNQLLAVARQVRYKPDITQLKQNLCLALETLQDPGNLGSILRTADWFGIRDIICSPYSADLYNPKVIQASMGSFLRVRVHYAELPWMISEIREEAFPVFGTSGNGEDIYQVDLPDRGLILLGNESRGLSEGLLAQTDRVFKIPPHNPDAHPESLNVSAAAAVICAEFRRQAYSK